MIRGFRSFASISQEQGSSDKIHMLFDESYSVLRNGRWRTLTPFNPQLVAHTINTKYRVIQIIWKSHHRRWTHAQTAAHQLQVPHTYAIWNPVVPPNAQGQKIDYISQ